MSNFDTVSWLGFAKAIKVGTAGDTFVPIPIGDKRVIFTFVPITNASTDLSLSVSLLSIYTGPLRTGTQILPPNAYQASNTSTTIWFDAALSMAQTTFALTAGGVYVNLNTVGGTAGTVDIYFQGSVLS